MSMWSEMSQYMPMSATSSATSEIAPGSADHPGNAPLPLGPGGGPIEKRVRPSRWAEPIASIAT